ncbi:MAG: sel1 repeat family protein, partial [Lentisphaeria bacterium]|nr:sel1 repeat family protein [Lentisphaeria bacterium]
MDRAPSVRIENSRGRIVSQNTGVDVISFVQMASQNTSALSIRRGDAPAVTWRVARSSPSGPVTLREAMEAINSLVRKAQGSDIPVFRITDGVLDSMAGVGNGAGRWWRLSIDGQDVDFDLARGLGRQVTISLGSKPPPVTSRYLGAIRSSAEAGVVLHQYFLGVCYALGTGVPKDGVEAVKWYRKAAEQNYASAQYNLGLCYHKGIVVPKDEAEAVKWYRKAAEQDYAPAQYNLSLCYHKGIVVPKDEDQVVKWSRKAAEQGDACGQMLLGGCYASG